MTAPASYPKGDFRRMLTVLAAISSTQGATLTMIASATGLSNKTVMDLIKQADQQAGVKIQKAKGIYNITDWGPAINKDGAALAEKELLNCRSSGRTLGLGYSLLKKSGAASRIKPDTEYRFTKSGSLVRTLDGCGHGDNETWTVERVDTKKKMTVYASSLIDPEDPSWPPG